MFGSWKNPWYWWHDSPCPLKQVRWITPCKCLFLCTDYNESYTSWGAGGCMADAWSWKDINLTHRVPLFFLLSVLTDRAIYIPVLPLAERYMCAAWKVGAMTSHTNWTRSCLLSQSFQVGFPLILFLLKLGAKRSTCSLWWETGVSQRAIYPLLN